MIADLKAVLYSVNNGGRKAIPLSTCLWQKSCKNRFVWQKGTATLFGWSTQDEEWVGCVMNSWRSAWLCKKLRKSDGKFFSLSSAGVKESTSSMWHYSVIIGIKNKRTDRFWTDSKTLISVVWVGCHITEAYSSFGQINVWQSINLRGVGGCQKFWRR